MVKVCSQEPFQVIKFDTVHLKQGYILTINNRSYISKKDTILLIPNSVHYKLNNNRAGNLFEKLDSSAQYNRLARELRNMILVRKKSSLKIETETTYKSETNFIAYQNKVIRNINFRQLNVFGPTVEDTTRTADSWIERTNNKLHFKTREYLLRNNLIVHEGDLVDPLRLADNERILREANYIHDARIYIRPVSEYSDSIDLYIVVKDVWPKAFDLNLNNFYSGSFAIWDKNILGFGHETRNNIFWNTKKKQGLGYEGLYSIPNIGGSFIRGRGTYMNKFGTETYGLAFDRNFYTPGVKYAGGLSVYKTTKLDIFQYPDTNLLAPVSFVKSDFWLGRSYTLKNGNAFNSRKNLALAFRISSTKMSQRPVVSENQFYNYQDRTLFLSSATYSSQRFYKSNLIYNYGRTEDIPLGFQLQLNSGYETREFKNRGFAGFNISYGNYFNKLGYFYFWLGQEGFMLDKKIEQGMITAKFNHFTALYKLNRFRFRHFIDIEYTKGINRFKDEYLTINDAYGLKGFYNDSIRSNERLNIHAESVCFSPWYFYEFRFVFFTSAEVSIFGNHKDIWKNPVYPALSFGVRIRNERLVFNTIELRFFVYPNKPSYSETQLVRFSGEQVLVPQNFETKPPTTSVFK